MSAKNKIVITIDCETTYDDTYELTEVARHIAVTVQNALDAERNTTRNACVGDTLLSMAVTARVKKAFTRYRTISVPTEND